MVCVCCVRVCVYVLWQEGHSENPLFREPTKMVIIIILKVRNEKCRFFKTGHCFFIMVSLPGGSGGGLPVARRGAGRQCLSVYFTHLLTNSASGTVLCMPWLASTSSWRHAATQLSTPLAPRRAGGRQRRRGAVRCMLSQFASLLNRAVSI